MQSLQTAVLDKMNPGKTPIIIVAPNLHDGDALAQLLSGVLIFRNENTGISSFGNNYFLNDTIERLLDAALHNNLKKIEDSRDTLKADAYRILGIDPPAVDADGNPLQNTEVKEESNIQTNPAEDAKKLAAEFRKALKFAYDIGFSNKDLLGLQLDYKTFIQFGLHTLFPSAYYVFLYGTEVAGFGNGGEYIAAICDFHKKKVSRSFVLNVKNVIYTPELVLETLPVSTDRIVKQIDYNSFVANAKQLFNYLRDTNDSNINYLNQHNPVLLSDTWVSGRDIAVVLVINEHSDKRQLKQKLQLYNYTFQQPPAIHIVCKDDIEKFQIEKVIGTAGINEKNIRVVLCASSVAMIINDVVHQSNAAYFIVDDLQQSFSTSRALMVLSNSKYVNMVVGFFEMHKLDQRSFSDLYTTDVLCVHSVINNCIFSKNSWKAAGGFDEQLDHYLSIWDFAIRLVQEKDTFIIQNDSYISKDKIEFADVDAKMIPYEGYVKVLNKHKDIFSQHITAVFKSFSERQYLPQQQILKLSEKIDGLNSLLHHSKYELRSVNELNMQLQQHIQLIESRWYFRLARKLGKLKKIFFKESASNKKGILKFLKFFLFTFTRPGFRIFRKVIKGGFKKLYLVIEDRPVQIVYLDNKSGGSNADPAIQTYHDWVTRKLNPDTLALEHQAITARLKAQPKISIVMPVYDPPVNFLKEAIESVINQSYKNWELCIADDCSPNPQIAKILNGYAIKDSRIKVVIREENGHISASSNSALALATGDYILFMDHDDLLTANCCIEVVNYIDQNPDNNDIIYSDEDKIDDTNTLSVPHFKPDWSPDNLLSRNYFGHVVVMRKELVDSVGGFRLGFEGSQDYDIILRTTELTSKIGHIPKVLYHWRIHDKSAAQGEDVKPYAYIAAKKALEEALERRNTPGEIQYLSGLRGYRVIYDVIKHGKVSVIIPTKDQVKLLKNTIDSIIQKTSYTDYEIILLNNNSNTQEFFDFRDEYTKKYPTLFRCIEANFPFNFSKLMNIGVAESTGEYMLLLNNDVEVIAPDWMTTMVSFAQHKDIGIVGAKLLYPDDTIQHAGVLIGLGGVAGHAFTHAYKDDPGYFNYIQSVNNYAAVTAACMMCRKDVFLEVNGMEESFEVEYNDVDFCLKVLDKGYYNVYVPEVVLYHFESATRGHPHQNSASYARHVREIALFKEKWQKYIDHDPYYNPNLNRGVHDFSMDMSK